LIRSGFAGLLFSGRRPQRGHLAPALSRKADERKLMFALGRDPTKFADLNKVEIPRTPTIMQTKKG
jgi:hypothetical protein